MFRKSRKPNKIVTEHTIVGNSRTETYRLWYAWIDKQKEETKTRGTDEGDAVIKLLEKHGESISTTLIRRQS